MYSKSNNYKNLNDNDISLRPSWLENKNFTKGCISIKKNNYYKIDNHINSNSNSNNGNDDNEGNKDIDLIEFSNEKNNENIKFGSIDFEYYSERKEFIKKNAVFLKPQYQNIETVEQYLKLLNKNKDLYSDENTIDNDINDFTIQKKKTRFSKYSLYSILLYPGKYASVPDNNNDNDNDINTEYPTQTNIKNTQNNKNNQNDISKRKLSKYKKNEYENYDSDASENNDENLVPDFEEINVKRR